MSDIDDLGVWQDLLIRQSAEMERALYSSVYRRTAKDYPEYCKLMAKSNEECRSIRNYNVRYPARRGGRVFSNPRAQAFHRKLHDIKWSDSDCE